MHYTPRCFFVKYDSFLNINGTKHKCKRVDIYETPVYLHTGKLIFNYTIFMSHTHSQFVCMIAD